MNTLLSENSIQSLIDEIIRKRKTRCREVEIQQQFWETAAEELEQALMQSREAEKANPEVAGAAAQLDDALTQVREHLENIRKIHARYNRDKICIGVGGAARMGKSTFLQNVTGLTDEQIPTSDRFFTTAGRSLIIHARDNYALADMHSKQSFLQKVLWPMFEDAGSTKRPSLDEFSKMKLSMPNDVPQESRDVIMRIIDTQKALPEIVPELTGRQKRIEIEQLRPYVAYPENGASKAGKFMAVSDIRIYAKFPAAGIEQLQVVDLPGLGEPGRNLAKVQTEGLSEVCDITLLIKRPEDANVAWTERDTQALDVMAESIPMLNDLSLYTAILMNSTQDPGRSADCREKILEHLKRSDRHLRLFDGDVRDGKKVREEILPKILRFLAESLPQVDEIIWRRMTDASCRLPQTLCKKLGAALENLLNGIPDANPLAFRDKLLNDLTVSLISEYVREQKRKADDDDHEWDEKVQETRKKVAAWIDNQNLELSKTLAAAIDQGNGKPLDIINQLRIDFRRQWDLMEEHLQDRVVKVLRGFLERICQHTGSFVPPADPGLKPLAQVRKQLKETAAKLRAAADSAESRKLMTQLAEPLERLSELELHFQFLLEAQLRDAAYLLQDEKLPPVSSANPEDAAKLQAAIVSQLMDGLDAYYKHLCAEKECREMRAQVVNQAQMLLQKSDPKSRTDFLNRLQESWQLAAPISPNRILAGVLDNETDAFIRFAGVRDAFRIWTDKYKQEMQEAPTPAIRAAENAAKTVIQLRDRLV